MTPSMTSPAARAAPGPGFRDPLAARLADWVARAEVLATEGLPLPVRQVRDLVEGERTRGQVDRAEEILGSAERLLERATRDWTLLRELLRRIDELKALALRAGLDLADLEERLGDPRAILKGQRLSEGLLERSMGIASKSLAILNDLLPQYFLGQARLLGRSIRSAHGRGEDTGEATERMNVFVRSLRSGQLRGTAVAFLELRRAVMQIPREPTVPLLPREEEEEIILEARNLARRLNRMKSKARDASSAARLMSQVRAALAEDRRFASPDDEIEELWNEVDRLTQERLDARPLDGADHPRTNPELDPTGIPPEILEAATGPLDAPPAPSPSRRARRGAR